MTSAPTSHRDVLFISHANPEDNEFTRWLVLRLAREGYKVWSDLTSLLGGEVTWMDIEEEMRTRTTKFLFVLSKYSNQKDGTRKELALAETMSKQISDRGFIIPLKIDDISYSEMNIEIHNRNAIPFADGWPLGFNQLLRKLESDAVPKNVTEGATVVSNWWRTNFDAENGLRVAQEEHLSNWFPIDGLPKHLYAHRVRTKDLPLTLPYSVTQFDRFLFSFASLRDLGIGTIHHADSLRPTLEEFIHGDLGKSTIQVGVARRCLVQLMNDAWQRFLLQTKLPMHQFSAFGRGIYFPDGFVTDNKIFFEGMNGRTYRQVCGLTKEAHWHFGIRSRALLFPVPAYEIKPHVLFSDDGTTIWESKDRLHRKRRSFCKSWWNDEWRDRILAVMSWLSGEGDAINVPLSRNLAIRISARPLSFFSSVAYTDPKERLTAGGQETEQDLDEEEE